MKTNMPQENPPPSPFYKGGQSIPLFSKEGFGEILKILIPIMKIITASYLGRESRLSLMSGRMPDLFSSYHLFPSPPSSPLRGEGWVRGQNKAGGLR